MRGYAETLEGKEVGNAYCGPVPSFEEFLAQGQDQADIEAGIKFLCHSCTEVFPYDEGYVKGFDGKDYCPSCAKEYQVHLPRYYVGKNWFGNIFVYDRDTKTPLPPRFYRFADASDEADRLNREVSK